MLSNVDMHDTMHGCTRVVHAMHTPSEEKPIVPSIEPSTMSDGYGRLYEPTYLAELRIYARVNVPYNPWERGFTGKYERGNVIRGRLCVNLRLKCPLNANHRQFSLSVC